MLTQRWNSRTSRMASSKSMYAMSLRVFCSRDSPVFAVTFDTTPPAVDIEKPYASATSNYYSSSTLNAASDWVLSQFHDTTCNTGSFMFRSGDWKYIAYPGYEPMLFDLRADPDEIRNLASARPAIVRQMDARLRSVVDYEAVDAKVKAYDRASFAAWRAEMKARGQYESLMSEIFSGADHVDAAHLNPWTAEDEARIEKWLGQGRGAGQTQ